MSGRTRLLFSGLYAFAIVSIIVLRSLQPHLFADASKWHMNLFGRDVDGLLLAFAGAFGLAVCALLTLAMSSRLYFVHYVQEAPPEALAWIRILACGILLGSVLWEDLGSIALLPPELRQSMGVMRFFYAFPGFAKFAANSPALQTLKWVAALILFLGMIGCFTRIVIPLGAISYLLIGGIMRQYSYFYHQGIVPLYLLLVLSWTPCGDAWSIDRLWRGYRGRPISNGPAAIYGWSRYACWAVLALTYVAAGTSKLWNGGLLWWSSANIRSIAYADTLNESRLARFNWGGISLHLTHAPDVLFSLFGILALLVEISYGLVLISRHARRILPAAAFLMHAGIFLLQKVMFFDFMLVQLVFVDVARIRQAIGKNKVPATDGPTIVLHPRESAWWPVATAGMVSMLLVVSFLRIEFYPLTSWQMYSGFSTEVAYTRMYAHHRSGVVTRAYIGDIVGALAGNRPQHYIGSCLSEATDPVHKCETFLKAVTAAYNRHAPLASRVTQLEIQEWSWDFLAYPSDPGRAALIRSFRFESPHDPEVR